MVRFASGESAPGGFAPPRPTPAPAAPDFAIDSSRQRQFLPKLRGQLHNKKVLGPTDHPALLLGDYDRFLPNLDPT